ncbi:MAG: OmpH family outer membrane protein [Bdellovibrio sp.]|nr:OmpH family outer membrane protein [Bdellovibrio sp.]
MIGKLKSRFGYIFSSAALVGAIGSFAWADTASAVKIGTVDMQKALQTVEMGKRAKAQLEKDFNFKNEELQRKKKAFDKKREEFEKQALAMNQEAAQKKQAALQAEYLGLQQEMARSQMEIQQKERDLFQPIFAKLKTVIEATAKKHQFTMVLEKGDTPVPTSSVLFSLPENDVTSEVITTFDKEHKSKKAD